MAKIKFLFLLIPVIILAGCTSKSTGPQWKVNDKEYLETRGFNVLVFHDYYPEGDQGGIEFIHHGNRIATNGFINFEQPADTRLPDPVRAMRTVDTLKNEISAKVFTADSSFSYTIRVWPEKASIHLAVDLDKPLPPELKDKVTFDLQLFPVTYQGKSYHLGDQFGLIPVEGLGAKTADAGGNLKTVPLAQGQKLLLAPEDPECKLQIEQVSGTLSLVDDRNNSLGGWLKVRSAIPESATKGALEWIITPNLIPDWTRKPVICLSQVGYHPDQVKQAVIELDENSGDPGKVTLQMLDSEGNTREIKSEIPGNWGKFLRYKYSIFDFTGIKEPGLYRISYGDVTSEPFAIAKDVYQKGVWQPTLEIYFPVQMCHMRIRDRSRVWHGACHLDDALQAPVNTQHVDGYRTYGATETNYKPFTTVPGLNRGGWHDAGDNDLAAGSQAQTTLFLALAGEQFGINVDQTTVKQDALYVELRKPDGVSDLLQQIEHGVINLLSGYRASGHSFVGIIETREGRSFLGDVASVTDQLLYDSSLKPGEVRGNRSGKADDRWVVTNKDTSLEYEVIAALAAASRLLKGYNDALAEECLRTAIRAWEYEQSHDPVIQRNAYVPGHYQWQEMIATSELLITTHEDRFRKALVSLLPVIKEAPAEVGWSAARAINLTDDENFKTQVREALQTYKAVLDKSLAGNPFGVPWRPQIWGIGWDIQHYAVEQYYLNRAFPELFGKENLLKVVNYVLGCHPGSSTSFVSAVGAHSLIPAYGFNMHWWSYIPGGMASGTALIRPDFPELKEPYPYIWQQTEYVMPGAATYIFCILAANQMLNG